MSGDVLGWLGAAIIAATGVFWFRRLRAVRIPRDRRPVFVAMGVGAALGALALAVGTGTTAGIAAGLAALAGGGFLGIQLQASQARQKPAVGVGEPLPDFVAPDQSGAPFASASLRGRPFLLKFFRGHW